MASRSRHLLFLTPPSLTRTPQPKSQQQAQPKLQPHPKPHSRRLQTRSKSQNRTTIFTSSSNQKSQFHTNQTNRNPLQKPIFFPRTEKLVEYVLLGIALALFWGTCVGIDKSRDAREKRMREGEEDDGNEYWFFGMFVRSKGRGDNQWGIEKVKEKCRDWR